MDANRARTLAFNYTLVAGRATAETGSSACWSRTTTPWRTVTLVPSQSLLNLHLVCRAHSAQRHVAEWANKHFGCLAGRQWRRQPRQQLCGRFAGGSGSISHIAARSTKLIRDQLGGKPVSSRRVRLISRRRASCSIIIPNRRRPDAAALPDRIDATWPVTCGAGNGDTRAPRFREGADQRRRVPAPERRFFPFRWSKSRSGLVRARHVSARPGRREDFRRLVQSGCVNGNSRTRHEG